MLARLACVLFHHGHHWPARINSPAELHTARCSGCDARPWWWRHLAG